MFPSSYVKAGVQVTKRLGSQVMLVINGLAYANQWLGR